MCAQRRPRSPWASAQSDQSRHCPDALAELSLLWEDSHFVGFVTRRLRSSFFHACVPLTKLRDIWTLILLCWSKRQIFGIVLRDQNLWTEEKECRFCGKRSLKSKPELRFHANVYLSIIKMCLISFIVRSQEHGCRSHWAASWKKKKKEKKMACAASEDSDQAGRLPCRIRAFAVRMKKAWVLSYPLSAQRKLWTDWADAQVALSLRWGHTHFVGFVMRRLIFNFKSDRKIPYTVGWLSVWQVNLSVIFKHLQQWIIGYSNYLYFIFHWFDRDNYRN